MADTPARPDKGDDDTSIGIPGRGDTPGDDVAHPTGADQAAVNRENDPPA